MRVGTSDHEYVWVDGWANLPDDERLHAGWAHHALVVTRDGHVVGIHPADGQIVVLDADGNMQRTIDCGLVEGHGMCLVETDGEEHLWIADCGIKMVPQPTADYGYAVHAPPSGGRVIAVRLSDGEVLRELPKPEHELYSSRPYLPTAVAVEPDGFVWVADGYGASLLHRFGPDGRLMLTLTGEESGAGRLDCPHGLLIDHRRQEPELYVADRENLRLVVFGLDGTYRREVAKSELGRPCSMATAGELLAVAELRARIALLDLDDRVVGHLGDNEAVADTPGWPNSVRDGKVVRQTSLVAGRFNSPHGLAVSADGSLYVTEWLIGGRYTKLEADVPSSE